MSTSGAPEILDSHEARYRKHILSGLQRELASMGIEAIVVGRHRLNLRAPGLGPLSGQCNPELHLLAVGRARVVTTDGERYHLADGTIHLADNVAGAAKRIAALRTQPGYRNDDADGLRDGQDLGRPVPGPGERALRKLIIDGIV